MTVIVTVSVVACCLFAGNILLHIGSAISNGVCIPLMIIVSIHTPSFSGVNRDYSGIICSRSKKE